MEHGQPAANTAHQSHNALIFRLFCSLRLSVRTPPFHGGESGSIPLGSASHFIGLASRPDPKLKGWPRSPAGAATSAMRNGQICGMDLGGIREPGWMHLPPAVGIRRQRMAVTVDRGGGSNLL